MRHQLQASNTARLGQLVLKEKILLFRPLIWPNFHKNALVARHFVCERA